MTGTCMLMIDPHPLLDLRAFVTEFPRSLGETPAPPELFALLSEAAAAPLHSDDGVREAGRALLRHRGQGRPAHQDRRGDAADAVAAMGNGGAVGPRGARGGVVSHAAGVVRGHDAARPLTGSLPPVTVCLTTPEDVHESHRHRVAS